MNSSTGALAFIGAVIVLALALYFGTGGNHPSTTPPPAPTDTAAIGQQAVVGGTTIGVLELLEDSRCAKGVECIWAGQVRVRASVNSYNRNFIFILGQPQTVGSTTITLSAVTPEKLQGQSPAPSDYRFTFTAEAVRPDTIPASASVSL